MSSEFFKDKKSARKIDKSIPPQALEAEESVIGAVLLDKEAIPLVLDILRPQDFYKPAHAKIYEAMVRLHEKHEPLDILSVSEELKALGYYDTIGGSSYITSIISRVPTVAHAEHYAKLVKEKKILRDIIRISGEITETALDPENEIEEVLDEAEKKIFSISEGSVSNKFTKISDEIKSAYERIEKMHSGGGKLRGASTGFSGLDSLLSGLQSSDLIILGARPSVGKTTFALDIARNVAILDKKPVGIFSLEMSKDQVFDRILSQTSGVPLFKLRSGNLSNEYDFELLQEAMGQLAEAPIFIDDTPSPTVLQMRSMARKLQAEHGLGLLVVDYLQLVKPRTNTDNVVSQVTEISRGLKGLGRELNVPVLALAQLSRSVEQREVRIPKLSDLRDSGSIEQDADVVMFIYRPDKDKINPEPGEDSITQIIIAKHRNGPLGVVDLKFNKDQVSFQDIDKRHAPQGEFSAGF